MGRDLCATRPPSWNSLYMKETHPTLDLIEMIQIDGKQVNQPKYDPFRTYHASEDYEGS